MVIGYLLLIVQPVVRVLAGAGVEVLDDVIGFSLQKVIVTVFNQEVFYFFPADVP